MLDTIYMMSKTVAAWVAVVSALVVTIAMGGVAHYRIGEISELEKSLEHNVREMDKRQVEILTDLKWIRTSVERIERIAP